MANGFDILKYKEKLDKERSDREAKYGKRNTIGMKIARCFVYGISAVMIWSVSTTFSMPELFQIIFNLVLMAILAYMCYKVLFKNPTTK